MTQTERIASLETALSEAMAKINELVAAVQPLATDVKYAHDRIDHASVIFNRLRAATVNALTPRTEPARIPRDEFDRALDDLRAQADEDGRPQRFFSVAEILDRAASLRRLEENTRAAAG